MPEPARSDVLIIGGGLIGLATAWRTAARGLSVTLCDPAPGANASFAAAGMLTPVTELHYGEEALLGLNLASAKRYPSFIAELQEAAGGLDPGYTEAGTLVVAFDGDDREVLADLHLFQQSLGLKAEWLAGSQARRLEPMLAPSVRGGLLVSGDHQVDNRMLLAALFAALEREPKTRIVRSKVAEVTVAADRATGVVLEDGTALAAEQVVLSAGCWSGQIGGIPPELLPPVRPIKGQILRLAVPEVFRPFLSRTVRYVVRNNQAYLVPRAHGELVLGATVEEQDYDTTVTAGGVYELLRDARELVPGITELPLIETRAALRPGTPDNAPMIGPTALPGLLYATGHYRHGVLLTPATADGMAEILATGAVPEALAPFSPQRFGRPQK
ncbi:glycine oxidase ThiO [Catenulispora pinisilvae]|uniref:glycine oxidase ThiO n=1 Tax=Catenulispora pinisilvae TaxID=2705253 RepID=UPI001E3D65F1|nr:glycine oxidase ThiO [Catenulispora pinisilvae]